MFSMKKDTLLFKQMEKWIKQEENDKVKFILEYTLPTDLVSINDITLLHLAAKHGNAHIMEYLKDKGVIENIDARDYFNTTPLMLAIDKQHWAAAKFLLDRNADIFATDDDGNSALLTIMRKYDLNSEVFNIFVDKVKSKNPNQIDFVSMLGKVGCTVDRIIYLHDPETTKVFLDWSTFAGTLTRLVEYNSVFVAMRTMDEENMKVLLHRGQVERRREDFVTCLRQSVMDSYQDESLLDIVRLAVEQLVKWKILSDANFHVMEWIIHDELEDRLRLILNDSLISYVKENFGFDIRVHMFGNKDALTMIKNGEIDKHTISRQGRTALHIATACGAIATMEYLLDCKMNPNIIDENGKTPIFEVYNALHFSEEALKLLLLYGADIQACDYSGKTILDFYSSSYGSSNTHLEIVAAHLAVLDSTTSLKDSFLNHIFAVEELSKTFSSCRQQMERMKMHKVHSTLTLFEVLSKSLESLTRRVKSLDLEVIDNFFNNSSIQEYDSYLISASKQRLEKAVTISNLRDKAVYVIGDSVKILKPYNLVLNKICSYLTYYDLCLFAGG